MNGLIVWVLKQKKTESCLSQFPVDQGCFTGKQIKAQRSLIYHNLIQGKSENSHI